MHPVDWAIVAGSVVFLTVMARRTRALNRSVADFLSANRCAGRYLLGVGEGMAGLGAFTVVQLFELTSTTGFTWTFWSSMSIPLSMLVMLSGWVIYRFRATRALTLAQFFEQRYSRRFRVFAGMVAWISGTLNFAIFPAVGARFFVQFCGLPQACVLLGVTVPTIAPVMLLLIGVSLYFTFCGGQIAVLVTDFWQGLFSLVVFAAVVVFLWIAFPWNHIAEGLRLASTEGKSLFNPMHIGQATDFNMTFYVMMWFLGLYHTMAWQGQQAYNSSAVSPHEAKMAKVAGGMRSQMMFLGILLVPICAVAYMHHPAYADGAEQVRSHLAQARSSSAACTGSGARRRARGRP